MSFAPYIEGEWQDDPAWLVPAVTAPFGGSDPDPLAYARAEHVSPSRSWVGLCLAFARTAWRVNPLYANAAQGWANTDHRIGTPVAPPAGSLCWWTGGSKGFGHVAISAGGGSIWTTDLIRTGQVDLAKLTDVHTGWGLTYAGASQDINETWVLIPPPDANDKAFLLGPFLEAIRR